MHRAVKTWHSAEGSRRPRKGGSGQAGLMGKTAWAFEDGEDLDEQIPSEETVVQALEVGMPGQIGDKQGEEGLRSRVETTGEVGCGRVLGAGSSSLQLT